MRTHSYYEPYLIIGQLVNGKFRAIRYQMVPVQIQTKEEWLLITEFLFNLLYFDSYAHNFLTNLRSMTPNNPF